MRRPNFAPGPWVRSMWGFQVLTGDSMRSICQLNFKDGWINQQIPTARLIASAPDLYEAVKAALEDSSDAREKLNLAFKKANGEI